MDCVVFREDHFEQTIENLRTTRKFLRLVGYSQGINYNHPHTERIKEQFFNRLENHLKENEINGLIFDGDHFSDSSFTFLLPEIHQKYPFLVIYAIITTRNVLEEFKLSWRYCLISEINILIPKEDSRDYSHHAIRCHELQNPSLVYCFGGGSVVLDEYNYIVQRSDDSRYKFHLFHIYRVVNGVQSSSPLVNHQLGQIYTHDEDLI